MHLSNIQDNPTHNGVLIIATQHNMRDGF